MTGGPGGRFHAPLRPDQSAQLWAFAVRESEAGRAAEVDALLQELDYRLRYEADEWGESREYLPVLRVQMRFGTVGPISVWYGVQIEARVVFVREFRFRGDPPGG